jgi:hypothetical protein
VFLDFHLRQRTKQPFQFRFFWHMPSLSKPPYGSRSLQASKRRFATRCRRKRSSARWHCIYYSSRAGVKWEDWANQCAKNTGMMRQSSQECPSYRVEDNDSSANA